MWMVSDRRPGRGQFGGALRFVVVVLLLAFTFGMKVVGDTPAFEERDGSVIFPFFLVMIVVVVVGLLLLRVFSRIVGATARGVARHAGASERTARNIGQVARAATGVAVALATMDAMDRDGGVAEAAGAGLDSADGGFAPDMTAGAMTAGDASTLDTLELEGADGLDAGHATAVAASSQWVAPVQPPPPSAPPPVDMYAPPPLTAPEPSVPDFDRSGDEVPMPPMESAAPPVGDAANAVPLTRGAPWPGEQGYVYLYEKHLHDPAGVSMGEVPVVVPAGVKGRGALDLEQLTTAFRLEHGHLATPGLLKMELDGRWKLLPGDDAP